MVVETRGGRLEMRVQEHRMDILQTHHEQQRSKMDKRGNGCRREPALSKQSATDSLTRMSGAIGLFCCVIGKPAKQISLVEVGRHEVWGSMKDAIKEKKKNKFPDVDADTLDLWKVRLCAISHVVAQLLPIQKVTIGRSRLSLSESEDFLKSVTTKNLLHPIDSLSTDLNVLPDDHINNTTRYQRFNCQ